VRANRRDSGSAISLFSFQDIITATAGIMILLVLLFSLTIATRSVQTETAPPSIDTPVEEPATDPVDEFLMLQDRLTALRQQEEARARLMVLESIQSSFQTSSNSVADLRMVSEQRKNDLKQALLNMKSREVELQEVMSVLQNRVALRTLTIEAKDQEMQRALIVECSGSTFRTGTLSTKQYVEHASDIDFLKWISENPRIRESPIVFLIKPSAGKTAFDVVQFLQEKGFTVGYDPLEEGISVRFGAGVR